MLTDIKYLKYIKPLCWSNKVKAGSAVFMTMRSVFLLLGGANLDAVIFYRIWMPLFLMHVLLFLSSGVVVRVFSRAWYEYGTLCICSCAGLVERVFLYHCMCSFFTLCGSSHMYWGLLLTCRVVERRIVLCRTNVTAAPRCCNILCS